MFTHNQLFPCAIDCVLLAVTFLVSAILFPSRVLPFLFNHTPLSFTFASPCSNGWFFSLSFSPPSSTSLWFHFFFLLFAFFIDFHIFCFFTPPSAFSCWFWFFLLCCFPSLSALTTTPCLTIFLFYLKNTK